jgi:F-type H+-transporting ATPase subunit a
LAAAGAGSADMLTQVHKALNVPWNFISPDPEHPAMKWLFGLVLNPKTLVMTWIVIVLVLIFSIAATRNMQVKKPGKLQVMIEMIYDFIKGLAFDNLDPKKGASLMTLLFTLFMFLLFSNVWGLIPTMSSPTSDVNTTLGMALFVFILVQILGLYYRKLKYFKHFIEPFVFFLPITLIEELSKPLTLAFRLYGNIYAGEVLMAVLLGLIPWYFGWIPSVIWLAFSIFISCIQAFIFTMLTIAYVSQVTAEHH